MIVNTTFYVEPALKSEFEGWARDCYVTAAVKSTGYVSSMVMRLLVEIEAGAVYIDKELKNSSEPNTPIKK